MKTFFDKIRFFYFINQDYIEIEYPRIKNLGFRIHQIINHSPPEKKTYEIIRFHNLPLLPQFPILNYFVDFADPVAKIIIEIDSKEFHTNKEKDKKRQIEIEKQGWKFYRIMANKTFLTIYEFYKQKTNENYEDADKKSLIEFINKYKSENIDCLILYLKQQYYDNDLSSKSISKYNIKNIQELELETYFDKKITRIIEWKNKYGYIYDDLIN